MADRTNADLRRQLSVNTLPQISRDLQGTDNPIPLSPQWLLSKPGENKPGIATGDSPLGPYSSYSNHADAINKASGDGGEFLDFEKKRDVFRPPLNDTEIGRRDRWRDEERESNSTIRRDRRREGDKDLGDTRKIERWTGDTRRAPSERWADSGNREGNYDQRRESKWNTRWGPDDKESESWRGEKWSDPTKDADGFREKGVPPLGNHGKETEREVDHHSRSWRSNPLQNRGKSDLVHQPSLTPNKQAPPFVFSRGRGESFSSNFSAGRGRSPVNNTSSQYHPVGSGTSVDKYEGVHGDPSSLRYSRNKLLDIYRMTDVTNWRKPLDGFAEVPPLTQAELLDPLALSTPTPEELAVLKGIDKGDIVSSGAPQVSKDGSFGRSSSDGGQSRRTRIGSREDFPGGVDDYKDEYNSRGDSMYSSGSDLKVDSKQISQFYEDSKFDGEVVSADGVSQMKADELVNRDAIMQENNLLHPGLPQRSQSAGDRSHGWRDFPPESRSRMSGMGWPQSLTDQGVEWEKNASASSSFYKDEPNWQSREGLHRQSSEVADIKSEASIMMGRDEAFTSRDKNASRNIIPQISPEDLSLCYKDPQGEIQGPFSGSDLIGWFEAGYFGIDLLVRLTNASADTPFSALGDVMPHLRMKARPPPGFGAPKPGDIAEVAGRAKYNGIEKHVAGISELDLTKNEHRNRLESATEAENRFLESLMSPLDISKGLQGYVGSSSGGLPPMGAESGVDLNFLLAQRLSTERQRSLPNPLQYWPGRDAAEMTPDSPSPYSKLLPMKINNPLPISQTSPAVNSGVNTWSNLTDIRSLSNALQGGLDIHPDKQHFNPQAGFGYQQQRLQSQQFATQPGDLPSGILSSEKLLSSGLPQDPQMLNLLQQQFLLSQLQQQAPAQLSPLDKLLILKQQQKQEQQQQLQQHLLSQLLAEQQSHQHGHLSAASPAGNASSIDHLLLRELQERLQINAQMPQNLPSALENFAPETIFNAQDEHMAKITTLSSQVPRVAEYGASSEGQPLHLPHQFFGITSIPKGWDAFPPQQIGDIQSSTALPKPASEVMEKPLNELPAMQKHPQAEDIQEHTASSVLKPDETIADAISEPTLEFIHLLEDSARSAAVSSVKTDINVSFTDKDSDTKDSNVYSTKESQEQSTADSSTVKEVKNTGQDIKKSSEKKSRKSKKAQQTSSDQGRVAAKTISGQTLKQDSEIESGDMKADTHLEVGETLYGTSLKAGDKASASSAVVNEHSQNIQHSSSRDNLGSMFETVEGKDDSREDAIPSGHRAWKPALGLRPKSLIEIQQEEQQRTQAEMMVSEITPSTYPALAPWAGVVASSEPKASRENHQDAKSVSVDATSTPSIKSKKSQLHDLLAEEVLAKTPERVAEALSDEKGSVQTPFVTAEMNVSAVDNDDFIEAKDTKKSRKRATKAAKGVGAKLPASVASVDVPVAPAPIEKGKSSRQIQQEKEVLPVPSSGPSLGDFVPWKGDQTNAAPIPAWCTDTGKLSKPTSLRDIQKEEEKKLASVQHEIQIPVAPKVQSNRGNRGSGSASWQLSGSSPSKAASPIQVSSGASAHLRSKIEDDLFWGPLDQSKDEAKRSDFPSLANVNSSVPKNTPVKGISGASLSRQKSHGGGKPAEYSLSSSPASLSAQSSSKGKRESVGKHTEAMDFRDWCENESVRLIGTKDTSFLEFCLKQSTSEAEMLLVANVGSFDPNHEFIDNFLKYKEMLPTDVIDTAFQSRNEGKDRILGKDVKTDINWGGGDIDRDLEGSSKEGKKKGKKGKKVSSSVLGFNVVSNRIMMGEIQSVED